MPMAMKALNQERFHGENTSYIWQISKDVWCEVKKSIIARQATKLYIKRDTLYMV